MIVLDLFVVFGFPLQEDSMLEFQCHYREEKWLTPRYFQFVEDFFNTANSLKEDKDCEPPPCPTTTKAAAAETTTAATESPSLHRSQTGEMIRIPVNKNII